MKTNVFIILLFLHYHCCKSESLNETETQPNETRVKIGKSNLLFRKTESNFAIENTYNGKLLNFTLGEFAFESYDEAKPNSISFVTSKSNMDAGFNRTNIKITRHKTDSFRQLGTFTFEWNARVKLCWQYDNSTWFNTIYGSINNKLSVLLFNTDGFALLYEDHKQIQWNDSKTKLCTTPQQIDPKQQEDRLNWLKIFVSSDIKSVLGTMNGANSFKKFQQIYDISVHNFGTDYYSTAKPFLYPIWTLSNDLVDNNNSNLALEAKNFVSKIKEKFDVGKVSLHFDGKWQKYDGDFAFELLDPKELVQKMHEVDASAQISFPVNIFVNRASFNFERFKFMMFTNRSSGQIVIDEDVEGGRLDLTRSSVQKWFLSKLTNLCDKATNVSFRLETGKFGSFDANSLFQSKANISTQISTYFVGKCSNSRIANYLPMVQIDQRVDSNFERNLQSLIPIALSLGLSRQMTHIVPNLVSENAQTNNPPEELYIRWVQATALMPLMKFSIPPWLYNNQTIVDIVAKCIDLHTQFVPTISNLAGFRKPIVQPMWRVFPNDTKTLTIKDQFMLGDEIVVAPVTVVGQRERSVYLPKGIWIDQHDNGYTGPGVFTVKAPLEELPYFKLFERIK